MTTPAWDNRLSGIYQIYSAVNGRSYIGSAVRNTLLEHNRIKREEAMS